MGQNQSNPFRKNAQLRSLSTHSDDEKSINNKPIVGIYSLPSTTDPHQGMIKASYVQWLESAGARVMPIPSNISSDQVSITLNSLNGLLFTGGSESVTPSARFLIQHALELNQKGDYFPVCGICLGLEWILQIVGDFRPTEMLHGLDSEDYPIPLLFTDLEKKESSRLMANCPPDLKEILSSENITYNHHQAGVSPLQFIQNQRLQNFFRLISINTDRKGRPFVSLCEGKEAGFFLFQFHPEKVMFDFSTNPSFSRIPHSPHARWASQYFANFFVDECRKSSHHFENPEQEDAVLIFNYPLTKRQGSEYVPIYYFDSS